MSEYIDKDWFDFKWVQYIHFVVGGSFKFGNARRYELKEGLDLPLSEIIKRCYNSFNDKKTYNYYPIKSIAMRFIPRNELFNGASTVYIRNIMALDDSDHIYIEFEKGITESECVLQLIEVIDEMDLELERFVLFTDTEKVIKSTSRKPIKGTTRQNVLMRDNYTCQICGATVKDGAKLEIDHIIPQSKGGTNDENNLQVLCQQCNREKHNRSDLLHDELKLAELKGV